MKPATLQTVTTISAPTRSAESGARLKRVAIFSDSFSERNGAGAYYHDLAAQLRPEVGALELFQPAEKSRLLQLALPLPGDSTQKLITPNIPRLWKRFHRLKPHVVVAVTPGPFGLLGMYLARRSGTGFLTAFHTHFEEIARLYGNAFFRGLANRYLVTTNRLLCRRSAAVMVNNGALVPIVERLGARKVEVMGTPLALTFLTTPCEAPPAILRRVLFAGRLAPEKNLPAILEAARALPELQFVIAGEGPLRKSLQREAKNLSNLRMTGWLDRESLRREMDAASLLLLPSHHETFGTVALEAMARGRPALVAESAGIHQWPELRGALFVLRREENLADALRRLLTQPSTVWQEKAHDARRAAEALNHNTIRQWADYASCYSKRRNE